MIIHIIIGLNVILFQRLGTAHEEELPYMFGAPLVDRLGHFPKNFTRAELALSEAFMTSLANFIKTGFVL